MVYKTAGFALLALGLAAKQAAAVETCAALITAVEAAPGGTEKTTITLEADLDCTFHFTINTSQNVEITSASTDAPNTLSIGALFAGDLLEETVGGASLIVNQGTLTLNGVNFASNSEDGYRAVYNTGTLSVQNCNFNLFHEGAFINAGGAIFSDSPESVTIEGSTFKSNIAFEQGGAMYLGGSETLVISNSVFQANEVGAVGTTDSLGPGAGGDIWANRNVEITITDSTFFGSAAEAGGGAIVCCGASITNTNFTGTDVFSNERHFGAVQVGGPDEEACDRALTVTGSTFSGCSVGSGVGEGGSLAIFDTTATLTECVFEASAGTAVLFESSSAAGDHKLEMTSCQFNENTNPSEVYASAFPQGSAVVVTNTGVSDGEVVEMGTFFNIFCFANVPYECEFVYDGAEVLHDGEFKCHICDIEGVRQDAGLDDDLLIVTERTVETDSSDDEDGLLLGLSIAVGLLSLVVIGGCTAWRCKKGERSAGATEAQPAPAAGETPAAAAPPATASVHGATAPAAPPATASEPTATAPATASVPALTGTAVEPTAQP